MDLLKQKLALAKRFKEETKYTARCERSFYRSLNPNVATDGENKLPL